MSERRISIPSIIIRGVDNFKSLRLPSLIELGKYYHKYLPPTPDLAYRKVQLDLWFDFCDKMFKIFVDSIGKVYFEEKFEFTNLVKITLRDILMYCRNITRKDAESLISERTYHFGGRSTIALVVPPDDRGSFQQKVTIFFILGNTENSGFYIDMPNNIGRISTKEMTKSSSTIREELSHLNNIKVGKTLVLKLGEDSYNRLSSYLKYLEENRNSLVLSSSEILLNHIIHTIQENKKVLIIDGVALNKYEYNKEQV